MKRPRSHLVSSEAEQIFMSSLPIEWVKIKITPDYGLDYAIQVFEKGESTNITFDVQLKGTERIRFNDNYIKFELDVKHLKFFNQHLRPIFLFIIDINSKELYWIAIQEYIHKYLSKDNPKWYKQKYVTISIPKENTLREFINIIKDKIIYIFKIISTINSLIPSWDEQAIIRNIYNDKEKISKIKEEMKYSLDEVELREIFLTNNRKEALDKLDEFINSLIADSRYDSVAKAIYTMTKFIIDIDENGCLYILKQISNLLENTDKIKDKSLIILMSGLFSYYQLFFLYKRFDESKLLYRLLSFPKKGYEVPISNKIIEYSILIRTLMKNFYDVISASILEGYFDISVILIYYITRFLIFTYIVLEIELDKELLIELSNYIFSFIELSENIAKKIKDQELLCCILQNKAQLYAEIGDEKYKEVLLYIRQIAEKNGFDNFISTSFSLMSDFEKHIREKEILKSMMKITDFDKIREICGDEKIDEYYRDMARMAGVNLEDEEDEISKIIRIGIKDRNPERVLKYCKYLHVEIGSYGMPGEMLGLPSAGYKYLICEKEQIGCRGLELDRMFEDLKNKKCNRCSFNEPHDSNWKWNLNYQKKRELEMKIIMDNIREYYNKLQ